jgi:mono/diheme cytochrome c family protein
MEFARNRIGFLLAGILVIALFGFGFYWQFARPALDVIVDYRDIETVKLGKEIYMEQCGSCHGANLEGQANWRERHADGRLPAPPHDETGHTWHHNDQQLFEFTKYGPAAFVGGGYESDMQGYKDDLTDREILAALAFIKSSWPKEVRERHDQINGRAGN